MWRVSILSVLVVFSLTSVLQGRVILETPRFSKAEELGPFAPSEIEEDKAPKPMAWLEGLYVQDGQMSPVFNSSTLNYNVTLSQGVTNRRVIAQVSLGTDNEKYKVKTKSRILQSHNVKFPSRLNGNNSVSLVEVHVSADDHQSVKYYLEVGHALQGRSKLWSVFLEGLFWTGLAIAIVVLGISGYSIYLSLSGGGVTGEGVQGNISSGQDGKYEAVIDPVRMGSSRR